MQKAGAAVCRLVNISTYTPPTVIEVVHRYDNANNMSTFTIAIVQENTKNSEPGLGLNINVQLQQNMKFSLLLKEELINVQQSYFNIRLQIYTKNRRL